MDPDDIMEKLFTHCNEAISFGFLKFPIWRGFRSLNEPFKELDSSVGERESQNTSNHYTLLLDNSPYMSGWPKRSKSFICTSDPSYASGYGKIYMLIPFDGVKIAVCPYRDFWFTPLKLPEFGHQYGGDYHCDMSGFTEWLDSLGLPATSFEDMVSYTLTDNFMRNIADYKANIPPQKFIPYLQMRLQPKLTRLKLMTIPEYAAAKPKQREVWFSGPCYAIKADFLRKILPKNHFPWL